MRKFWIWRNKNGNLCVSPTKPHRYKETNEDTGEIEEGFFVYNSSIFSLDNDLFSSITWENSPRRITMQID